MDMHLKHNQHLWPALCSEHKTEEFMQLYSMAIEDATAEYAQLGDVQYKKLMGRSTVNIQQAKDRHCNL